MNFQMNSCIVKEMNNKYMSPSSKDNLRHIRLLWILEDECFIVESVIEYNGQHNINLSSIIYGLSIYPICLGNDGYYNDKNVGQSDLTRTLSVLQARPLFKDRRKFPKMADPLLQGRYPMRGLYQALAVAAMCLQEQAATRPLIGDVVTALTYLASQTYDPNANSSGSSRSMSRDWDEPKNDAQDKTGHGGPYHDTNAPYQGSQNVRRKELVREISIGAEVGRGESGGGSGRKWALDELEAQDSQLDSAIYAGKQRESLKRSIY